jgi:hypothetical protein
MQRLRRAGGQIQQIPNGLRFRQPEINWDSSRVLGLHPSISTLTVALISARNANPYHLAKHKWSTDPAAVADEIENYNVRVCLAMGWDKFVEDAGGGGVVPLSRPPNPDEQRLLDVAAAKARKLWAGIRTISDWLEAKAPGVPKELSEKRAATCVACPFNSQEDLTSWFTIPAANAIRRQVERIKEKQLSTSLDDKLGICAEKNGNGGCLCVLRVAVHLPLDLKLKHLAPDVKASLHESCWVHSEERALAAVPA